MTDERDMTDGRSAAREFARNLEEIYGEALVAVVLYGSAAGDEYRPGISDLNLLVILRDLELTQLVRVAAITRDWIAAGNPPPLMLSEDEWWSSADVFPIEYSDIRDHHVLLAGRDPFDRLRIDRPHLRLQLEHELRSKKIQLREGYLATAEVPEEVGKLLLASISTFLTLFRALLRLASKPVPREPRDVIDAAATMVGFRAAPVVEVLRARDSPETFAAPLDGPIAAGYLQAVERTVTWLDRLEPGPSTGDEI